ncbi:radical SAM protein [Streptomyces cinerochromogenes]|uniref:radical SAM protein n=1 Tax=Streptomyces cinerochromogenes TaxID=66422 RepID=UPI0033A73A0E
MTPGTSAKASAPAPSADEAFRSEMLASLTSDSLHLILLPTEQCNFRCVYCYEDFQIGRMADVTVQAVKHLVDRRVGELRALGVSWFGGEPLLARSIVEDISSHITAAVANRDSVTYTADMTTNGYLLDAATFARLTSLGIRSYQVSLDGPQTVHDRTRIRANGHGSFARIWENLLAIQRTRTDAQVLLRVHLTPANLHAMPELLRNIRGTFLSDKRFSVLLRPVEHMGGPNDAHLDVLDQRQRDIAITELRSLLTEDEASPSLFDAPDVCYASRPNSLLIRADGRVGKCTVALNDPANTIGALSPDGSLRIDQARFSPWVRGWQATDWNAVGCPYAGMPRREVPLLSIGRGPGRPAL